MSKSSIPNETIPLILVGHTVWKFKRLQELVSDSAANAKFHSVTIFNGTENVACDHRIENDLAFRDVGMFKHGFDMLPNCTFAICLNDDVEKIDPNALLEISGLINSGADMVSAQPNLSHWISYDHLSGRALAFHRARGRNINFVRTSAFGCTKKYFYALFSQSRSAQEFEKGTINKMSGYSVGFLERFDRIYDGNLAPFIPAYLKSISQ